MAKDKGGLPKILQVGMNCRSAPKLSADSSSWFFLETKQVERSCHYWKANVKTKKTQNLWQRPKGSYLKFSPFYRNEIWVAWIIRHPNPDPKEKRNMIMENWNIWHHRNMDCWTRFMCYVGPANGATMVLKPNSKTKEKQRKHSNSIKTSLITPKVKHWRIIWFILQLRFLLELESSVT